MNTTVRHVCWPVPGFRQGILVVGLSILAGCQTTLSSNELRGPAVSARFTTNPLADEKFDRNYTLPPTSVPSLKLGLNMQSGEDPVHSHFASNLGTVLMRELLLSTPTLAVEPLVNLQPQLPVPGVPDQTTAGIISVAFTSPQDGLPPQLPPHPMFHSEAPPIVDQILVVRVIEYRPYYPLRATLEVRVLEGQSQSAIFTTTATWSGEEYEAGKKKFSLKDTLLCRNNQAQPAPGHNSPQALMHEISGDLAAWYKHASSSMLVTAVAQEKSWQRSWRRMFAQKECPPSTVSVKAPSPQTNLPVSPPANPPAPMGPPAVAEPLPSPTTPAPETTEPLVPPATTL